MARSKGNVNIKVKRGRGYLRQIKNKINTSSGLYGASTKIVNLPSNEKNIKIKISDSALKLCKNCFSELGK